MRSARLTTFALALGIGVGIAGVNLPALADPNPHLVRARSELDALRYDEARASLAAALREGGSSPDETAEIHRLSAQVAAALGDSAAAQDHFRRLLAVRPDTKLPAGTSPKIAAPFSAALDRARVDGPLRTRAETDGTWPPSVRLVVDQDPIGMIAGAEVFWWIDGSERTRVVARGGGTISAAIPLGEQPSGRVLAEVAALDRYGNRLVVHDQPIVVWEPSAAPPEEPLEVVGPRPFYVRPYTWAGLAVGFLGVGGYFAFRAMQSQSELDDLMAASSEHNASEALAVQRRGERQAVVANINFAIGGGFALVAAILLVRDLVSDDAKPERTTALPTVYPGGAGLVLTGRF